MFVITADQIDSRNDRDRATELIEELTGRFGRAFSLPPDQTSGDEIQVMTTDAGAALRVILAIHRSEHWSIGLGVGAVRTPLPAATRRATGGAFIAARDAVTRAKRADARFALSAEGAGAAGRAIGAGGAGGPAAAAGAGGAAGAAGAGAKAEAGDATAAAGAGHPLALGADDVEALVSMLLLLRQRRTPEGWEAVDLLSEGLSQTDAAARLGISTAAVSQRVKSALWRVEEAASPALVRLLETLDRATSETDTAA
jgi:DNA-directed RNA polymerase specialized sigma24 family protein